MLVALGVNHKSAPIAIREKWALSGDSHKVALQQLLADMSCLEAVILSTCNRTEIYCHVREVESLIRRWQQLLILDVSEMVPYMYTHFNHECVQHVMRVASGLDSMVLGESEILGQLKIAYQTSMELGAVGKQLSRLFQNTFLAAKQVRTNTAIGSHPISISYAAIQLAKQIFTDLKHAKVLLIGAGENSVLLMKHLLAKGVSDITIANRNVEKANILANQFIGKAIGLETISEQLERVDIVISSTASPSFIITQEMVERVLPLRKYKPLFMLDLAVPRDIAPSLSKIEEVYLYNIDDLQQIVEKNQSLRKKAILSAEVIIDNFVEQHMSWIHAEKIIEEVKLYRKKIEKLKQTELEKAKRLLASGVSAEEIIERLAHNMSQKMMHAPTKGLKRLRTQNEGAVLTAMQELLDVEF